MTEAAIAQKRIPLRASVRGAAHIRSGQPNQDAALAEVLADLPAAIAAVADGHGSAKCLRADRGARLAVETAAAVLREFAAAAGELALPEIESRARELPRKIVSRWRTAVREHLAAQPLDDGELAALEPAAAARLREALERDDPYLLYGATLLAVLATDACLLCLQVGDGEILVAASDAGGVKKPMADDATLIANETSSLCQDDAEQSFRLYVQPAPPAPPALVLLATDGYPNSFQTAEGFRQVASDLLAIVQQDGVESVRQSLPGWLDEASQLGSGDDVSAAILYFPAPETAT